MFKRLANLLGFGAGVLLVCFPALAQTPLAGAWKQPRYDFRLKTFRVINLERGCFCDEQCMEDAKARTGPLSKRVNDWKPPAIAGFDLEGLQKSLRVNRFSDRKPDDIQAIDLAGLQKLLQRGPKDTRPLLVNFWATWCDPCREEFPDLVKVDNDYRSKGLNFVAISLDDLSDIKSAVPAFLKEMKATMPVVLLNVNDPEPAIKVVDATWDGQLPATFLYDNQGKIVFKHFGRIQPLELRAAIDKELKGKQ